MAAPGRLGLCCVLSLFCFSSVLFLTQGNCAFTVQCRVLSPFFAAVLIVIDFRAAASATVRARKIRGYEIDRDWSYGRRFRVGNETVGLEW